MSTVRIESRDTSVRLDSEVTGEDRGKVQLVMYDMDGHSVVFEGTPSSVLMLVDRINDRVHGLRGGLKEAHGEVREVKNPAWTEVLYGA